MASKRGVGVGSGVGAGSGVGSGDSVGVGSGVRVPVRVGVGVDASSGLLPSDVHPGRPTAPVPRILIILLLSIIEFHVPLINVFLA